MWDERSFDSNSFSPTSWWLNATQVITRAIHAIAREVRTYVVAAEFRVQAVGFELRDLVFSGEKRTHELELEARALRISSGPSQAVVVLTKSISIPSEVREFEVPTEGRGVKVAGEQRQLSIQLETRRLSIPAQL